MAENINSPEIRFKGFTDPWEQRKLGDVAEIIGGGTPDTNNPDYWDGNIDWYSPAELGEQIYADASQRRITKLGYENSSAKMLPADKTILFTSRAGIGTTAILRRSACTNQGFQSLVLSDDVNVYFIYSMSSRIKAYAESKASGSTFLEISAKLLGDMDVRLPCRAEQDAIGGYFQQLDNLITLHQRKHEKLVQMKKAMLDRMFPKPGARFPEIRFEGFTDPWEQRKFSEMYVINNERNENRALGYGTTLSVATMTYNGGNGAADGSLNTYKVVRVGDIAFEGHANKEHAYGRFVLNDAGDGLMSPRFSCLRPIIEQRYSFWKYYIPRESIMRPVLVNATKSGTMMNELVPADLMRESILVPGLAEQETIGRFFKQVDFLIALHQREHEKLVQMKKAMLDRMFV